MALSGGKGGVKRSVVTYKIGGKKVTAEKFLHEAQQKADVKLTTSGGQATSLGRDVGVELSKGVRVQIIDPKTGKVTYEEYGTRTEPTRAELEREEQKKAKVQILDTRKLGADYNPIETTSAQAFETPSYIPPRQATKSEETTQAGKILSALAGGKVVKQPTQEYILSKEGREIKVRGTTSTIGQYAQQGFKVETPQRELVQFQGLKYSHVFEKELADYNKGIGVGYAIETITKPEGEKSIYEKFQEKTFGRIDPFLESKGLSSKVYLTPTGLFAFPLPKGAKPKLFKETPLTFGTSADILTWITPGTQQIKTGVLGLSMGIGAYKSGRRGDKIFQDWKFAGSSVLDIGFGGLVFYKPVKNLKTSLFSDKELKSIIAPIESGKGLTMLELSKQGKLRSSSFINIKEIKQPILFETPTSASVKVQLRNIMTGETKVGEKLPSTIRLFDIPKERVPEFTDVIFGKGNRFLLEKQGQITGLKGKNILFKEFLFVSKYGKREIALGLKETRVYSRTGVNIFKDVINPSRYFKGFKDIKGTLGEDVMIGKDFKIGFTRPFKRGTYSISDVEMTTSPLGRKGKLDISKGTLLEIENFPSFFKELKMKEIKFADVFKEIRKGKYSPLKVEGGINFMKGKPSGKAPDLFKSLMKLSYQKQPNIFKDIVKSGRKARVSQAPLKTKLVIKPTSFGFPTGLSSFESLGVSEYESYNIFKGGIGLQKEKTMTNNLLGITSSELKGSFKPIESMSSKIISREREIFRPIEREIFKPVSIGTTREIFRPIERATTKPIERAVSRNVERTVSRAIQRNILRTTQRQITPSLFNTKIPPPYFPPFEFKLPKTKTKKWNIFKGVKQRKFYVSSIVGILSGKSILEAPRTRTSGLGFRKPVRKKRKEVKSMAKKKGRKKKK